MLLAECLHEDQAITELGTIWCRDCRIEFNEGGSERYVAPICCAACFGTAEEAEGYAACCSTLGAALTPMIAVAL